MTFDGATIDGPVTSPAGSDITILGDVTFNDLVSGAGGFFGPGTAIFNGGHSPGDSTAVVPVGGNLTYGSSNELLIELGGLLDGEFDRLEIFGDATLDGNLVVEPLNNFTPSEGDTFEILDIGGTLSGQFLGLGEGDLLSASSGQQFTISYLGGDGNDVVLTAAAGIAGDFNFDGEVNGADFLLWQRGGSPNPLSTADLDVWQSNYGTVPALSAVQTVPEPGTLLLGIVGVLGASRRFSSQSVSAGRRKM